MKQPTVGVLALQGDVQAHAAALKRCGVAAREVKRAADLDGLHGLVLPGGETTTMWHFLDANGLGESIRAFVQDGGAAYGTCAGAILLARDIRNPDRAGLGLLDAVVQRNGYGRQTESSIRTVEPASGEPFEAVLIRAPRVLEVGPQVTVLASLDGDPVWVEQGRVMATTFHPELSTDLRFHHRFLELCQELAPFTTNANTIAP